MDSIFLLLLNFISIVLLAFFSMAEMAIISANPIRIEFLANQNFSAAQKILQLLKRPSRLFATTLIGVNLFMMSGSEFSREFHQSIGLDPDFAPLSQILVVILFGELVPQFAARKFSDKVALFSAPFIYGISKLLSPFVSLLEALTKVMNLVMGTKERSHQFLMTEEEIEKILSDEEKASEKKTDVETMASKIFKWKEQKAAHVMIFLHQIALFPSSISIAELRSSLNGKEKWIVLQSKERNNLMGIVYIRDLLRASETKKARDFLIKPSFVTEETPLSTLLTLFRRNSETIAFVVNSEGNPIGLVTLDTLLAPLYPKKYSVASPKEIVDVTVHGNISLIEFDLRFHTELAKSGELTLSEFLHSRSIEPPQEGDSLSIPPYELIVRACSMMNVTKVQVRSLRE